jgi:hypothetical protein
MPWCARFLPAGNTRAAHDVTMGQNEEKQIKDTQPDKDLAAEQRPRPSQAEGDSETIEEDLERRKD